LAATRKIEPTIPSGFDLTPKKWTGNLSGDRVIQSTPVILFKLNQRKVPCNPLLNGGKHDLLIKLHTELLPSDASSPVFLKVE
jgi:hypothetical protein